MRGLLIGLLVACVGVVSISAAPKAIAPATIELNVVATAAATSTIWPSLGDSINFAVTFPKSAEKFGPRIQVACYQGDQLVYAEAGPYYQYFLLGGASSDWLNTSQGPAHCVADLYYWSYQGGQKFNWLATTEFEAAGQS